MSARIPFLDLTQHVGALRAELDDAIRSVLHEGRFVGGEPIAEFEKEFGRWCGASYAVGVASGTDAIEISLRAVGVGPGDEVITVANTCVPTVAGIEASGATPVLVDADPESMTIDANQVAAAVGPRTRALVPVHLYGRCADMDAILEIARANALKVVEDCAQAHGATYRGQRAGTLGDVGAFSFYPTKNLGALGDGGAIVTSDEAIADAARALRSYGEVERYESIMRGTNSRLDTIQAAVLLVKLRHLDVWIERRREVAARYSAVLRERGYPTPADPVGGRHAYHLYVFAFAPRQVLRERLAARGIETLVHYPKAVHQHPAYEGIRRISDLRVSERLASDVLSLPLYPEMTDDEIDAVAAALSASLERR